jgi:predicted 3-demethylubiquinone-9 3-methyltransferase (glyoxalase superfamily)
MPDLVTCIWYDFGEAQKAVAFYASVFKDIKVGGSTPNPEGAPGPAGDAITVEFELMGQKFIGLNGGPHFKPNEAISFQIICADQTEVDHYWDRLVEGGGEHSQCGWLKDRWGVSWQVVPEALPRLISGDDPERAKRVTAAMMQMAKLDIARLEAAAEAQQA